MSRGAMEPEDEKDKKINDDVVVFMRKCSETEAPRYTAGLRTYVKFNRKRHRAAAARRHSGGHYDKKPNSASRKKYDDDVKYKGAENQEHPANEEDRMSRSRRGGNKCMCRTHSLSRSGTGKEPADRCGRRRLRKNTGRRRRRRRSCRRRRRRQRSCRRKRRRSCSRRRRRRSCRRRRRRRGGCRLKRSRRC